MAEQRRVILSIDPIEELLVASAIVHGPTRRSIRTVDQAREYARAQSAAIRRAIEAREARSEDVGREDG